MLVFVVVWFEVPDVIRYQIRRFRKKKKKKRFLKNLSGTPFVVSRVKLCSDLCTTCIKVKKIRFARIIFIIPYMFLVPPLKNNLITSLSSIGRHNGDKLHSLCEIGDYRFV
jgi:hypothetical protein